MGNNKECFVTEEDSVCPLWINFLSGFLGLKNLNSLNRLECVFFSALEAVNLSLQKSGLLRFLPNQIIPKTSFIPESYLADFREISFKYRIYYQVIKYYNLNTLPLFCFNKLYLYR